MHQHDKTREGNAKIGRQARRSVRRECRRIPARASIFARASPQKKVGAHGKVIDKSLFVELRDGEGRDHVYSRKDLKKTHKRGAPINVKNAI